MHLRGTLGLAPKNLGRKSIEEQNDEDKKTEQDRLSEWPRNR